MVQFASYLRRFLCKTRLIFPRINGPIMSLLLKLERKQNNSSNAFRIRIFLFRSYSFGIETITTFILSRSSLENHIISYLDQNGQSVYPFQIQKAPKPYRLGRHIPIYGLYARVPRGELPCSSGSVCFRLVNMLDQLQRLYC